jgi:hypothetical protein
MAKGRHRIIAINLEIEVFTLDFMRPQIRVDQMGLNGSLRKARA